MNLEERIESRRAVVAVVGLGYVGLPLARAFVAAGFRVLGVDSCPEKVAQVGAELEHELFKATVDAHELVEADAIVLAVPTPLGAHAEPDLSHVIAAAEAAAPCLRRGNLVVLASTTYPGTTREVVAPLLAMSGLEIGRDVHLAYAPEREDPGRVDPPSSEIPRLVGGVDQASGELCRRLYASAFREVHLVRDAETAEAAKLFENVFRGVNIALVNELKTVFDAMGLDTHEVIDAAATKPFGFMKFSPGPGMGGHCIPIDPFYLAWAARKAGRPTKFVELAGEINRAMPDWVVGKTTLALNGRGRAVRGARVLVLGLAYKSNVSDVRESPAVELIRRFTELGATVQCVDPHVVDLPRRLRGANLAAEVELVELDQERLGQADVVVLATAHDAFDYDSIARASGIVVDTRGVLRSRMAGRANYVSA